MRFLKNFYWRLTLKPYNAGVTAGYERGYQQGIEHAKKNDYYTRNFKRGYNDIKQAEGILLDKNLIWSSDFEAIRLPLAEMMRASASMGHYAHPAIAKIAQALIATENDLTI